MTPQARVAAAAAKTPAEESDLPGVNPVLVAGAADVEGANRNARALEPEPAAPASGVAPLEGAEWFRRATRGRDRPLATRAQPKEPRDRREDGSQCPPGATNSEQPG